jgi:hypothetical protein
MQVPIKLCATEKTIIIDAELPFLNLRVAMNESIRFLLLFTSEALTDTTELPAR